MRVLVTDITSYKAVVVCESLSAESDIEIFTADSRSYSRYVRTKYSTEHSIYPSASSNPEGFVNDLSRIVTQKSIDVLIPVNSREMRLCLKARAKFGHALDVFGRYQDFCRLDDKLQLAELCRSLDIPHPRFFATLSDVPVSTRLVIKPAQSSSSKGVRYVQRPDDLERIRQELGDARDHVIQEFVEGRGVGLSVLAQNGVIKARYGHLRLAEYPVSGGSSTIRTGFQHDTMDSIAEKIVASVGWTGFAMFEFKLTPVGDIVLIEVNPRVWGSIAQAIRSGVNFPLLMVKSRSFLEPVDHKRVITYLSPLHWFSLLGQALSTSDWKPLRDFVFRDWMRASPDVSLYRDPKAYIGLVFRALSVE